MAHGPARCSARPWHLETCIRLLKMRHLSWHSPRVQATAFLCPGYFFSPCIMIQFALQSFSSELRECLSWQERLASNPRKSRKKNNKVSSFYFSGQKSNRKQAAHSSSPSEKTIVRIIKGIISISTHKEAPKSSTMWLDSRSSTMIFKHRRGSYLYSTGMTLSSPLADALKGALVDMKELYLGT